MPYAGVAIIIEPPFLQSDNIVDRYPISFATIDSVFGPVPNIGFLGWVHCTGTEESLLECEYKRNKGCNRLYDLKGSGVICRGRAG